MSLFKNILSEMYLLLEDADITSVNNAISNLHPAKIRYNDGEPDAKTGMRTIYPVAYGISTAGNPVVRAYQPEGDTKRGVPKWKFFKLANITYWNTEENNTFDPQELIGFNSKGDAQIKTLYNIAPIGNGKQYTKQPGEKMTAIKPGPITKQDVDVSSEKYSADNAVNDILSGLGQKNIDNLNAKTDIENGNKIYAPKETAPITKSDIKVQDIPVNNSVTTNNVTQNVSTDGPISKDDIEPEENGVDNPLKKAYDDMLGRMDNLNKDKEEKEEV